MTREYAKVAPNFWTGQTGKQIREAGRDAQVIALYLLTCPSANMIGLYYLPMPVLMHETGMTFEGASKGLRMVCETGFASFEGVFEHVFIPEMACHQIGESLSENDNRQKGVVREWLSMRKSPFFMDFYRRYKDCYHLPDPSPFEAPSKPLRSQEQEQEQEQEIEQEQEREAKAAPRLPRPQFVAPTLEEVRTYCRERKSVVVPDTFVDYYEARGWMAGRSPMKDWKACLRAWEKRDNGKPAAADPVSAFKASQAAADREAAKRRKERETHGTPEEARAVIQEALRAVKGVA